MSKISKDHKKQIRKAFKDHKSTTASPDTGKRKIKWNFGIGDLVEYQASSTFLTGIVVSEDRSGYFQVLSSFGRSWVNAKKLRTIQKINEET